MNGAVSTTVRCTSSRFPPSPCRRGFTPPSAGSRCSSPSARPRRSTSSLSSSFSACRCRRRSSSWNGWPRGRQRGCFARATPRATSSTPPPSSSSCPPRRCRSSSPSPRCPDCRDGNRLRVGGAATAAYWRLAAVRAVVSILSPIALLSPGWFLFLSPASRFLVRWSPPRALAVRVGNPAPAVMVIFDEFSGISLMDRDRRIDRGRFPNLAVLADDGVWFRNATTVSGETESAIPAVLTGNRPAPGASRALRGRVSLQPVHPVGQEPSGDRGGAADVALSGRPLRPPGDADALAAASAVVSDRRRRPGVAILLPAEGPLAGPHVAGRWGCFLNQERRRLGRSDGPSPRGLRRIPREDSPGETAALYFAHAVLPHKPSDLSSLGQGVSTHAPAAATRPQRVGRRRAIGWLRATECWTTDPWAVAQARQRYLLQIAMVDRLVGRLVQR